MPRKLRVQYPGAIHHVMSRGDRREDIFLDDVDRQDFLKTLAEACQKTDWQVHAYCLLSNHCHLVVETPNANLVEGIQQDSPAGRQHFERLMEQRRLEETDPETLKRFIAIEERNQPEPQEHCRPSAPGHHQKRW